MMIGVDRLSKLTLSHCMDRQKEEKPADVNSHEADPRHSSAEIMCFFVSYSAAEPSLCCAILLPSHT